MNAERSTLLRNLLHRFSGPMSFRFIVQPTVAVFLGIVDGIADARTGAKPSTTGVLLHPTRRQNLRVILRRLVAPILIGTALDEIAQYLIFGDVNFLGALIVGFLVIALPYFLARSLAHYIAWGCHLWNTRRRRHT